MKIKLIDLLNKIANGEEVPKEIRFDNTYWKRIYGKKCVYYLNDNDNDLFVYIFRKNLTFTLNDEVEIIEEDKKIEKIKWEEKESLACFQTDKTTIQILSRRTEKIKKSLNQLIDAVNELKGGVDNGNNW